MARFTNGSLAEKLIDLKITVDDENDCTPVIQAQQVGSIEESSAAGSCLRNPAAFLTLWKMHVELHHSAPVGHFQVLW